MGAWSVGRDAVVADLIERDDVYVQVSGITADVGTKIFKIGKLEDKEGPEPPAQPPPPSPPATSSPSRPRSREEMQARGVDAEKRTKRRAKATASRASKRRSDRAKKKRETAAAAAETPTQVKGATSDLGKLTGLVLEWIPAEIVVIYGALLTLFVQSDPASSGTASVVLTVIGVLLASGFVVASAWANTTEDWWTRRVRVRAGLASGGFVIWSVTVPNSGWGQIGWVSENPAQAAAVAGVVGLFYSLFATGADARWSS